MRVTQPRLNMENNFPAQTEKAYNYLIKIMLQTMRVIYKISNYFNPVESTLSSGM